MFPRCLQFSLSAANHNIHDDFVLDIDLNIKQAGLASHPQLAVMLLTNGLA
jgi:hypothetical protein